MARAQCCVNSASPFGACATAVTLDDEHDQQRRNDLDAHAALPGAARIAQIRAGPAMVSAPDRHRAHVSSANAHHHRPVLGVLLKLASVVLLSCLAACVKYLGDGVPTGQIIFVRGVISMVVLGFIAWRVEGLHVLRTDKTEVARRALVGGHREHVLLVHGAHDDPARGLHGHQLHGADVPDGARDGAARRAHPRLPLDARSRSASSAC